MIPDGGLPIDPFEEVDKDQDKLYMSSRLIHAYERNQLGYLPTRDTFHVPAKSTLLHCSYLPAPNRSTLLTHKLKLLRVQTKRTRTSQNDSSENVVNANKFSA